MKMLSSEQTYDAPAGSRLPAPVKFLFSFHGRIGRRSYVVFQIVLLALLFGASYLVEWISRWRGEVTDSGTAYFGEAVLGIWTLCLFLLLWVHLAVAVKRMHDRGRTGWFLLLLLVPIVSLWPLVELGFLSGTDGSNEFGDDVLTSTGSVEPPKPSWKSFAFDFTCLALALCLTLSGYAQRWHVYNTSTGSMMPTLDGSDVVVFSKYFFSPAPKHGDVVVFLRPDKPQDTAIKRIVGLPGDMVEIRAGKLYVNGVVALRLVLPDVTLGVEDQQETYNQYIETLSGGPSYKVLLMAQPQPQYDDVAPVIVPPAEVYVLGDNRDESIDSRSFGPVPFTNLEGQARFRIFSEAIQMLPTGELSSNVLWSRILTAIN